MAKLFFNPKLIQFFCQNVPSSIIRKCIHTIYGILYCISYMGNTVDFLPYMIEIVGGKKKKPAKHGKMGWTPKQ